ncbi:uncharacterized protein LOC107696430 isoform X1 [Sinocyclocheilus anshuiensis]|uniref:uncharacterized protein LOC107696430 isoform X1 n=1 Tax=Sinocyclocheilus anshuiensis TaxID=1608454 RepID=UPI0007B9C2E0|nr:PREDICTED: uncharacterized protein LOC107696430 isoform X1 [Sinocyclocheilus anshuiensis]
MLSLVGTCGDESAPLYLSVAFFRSLALRNAFLPIRVTGREGRELNEVNNVTCKASNERPPCQAFEVPLAHRIRSFPGGSSRLQVHRNRAQETGLC